MKASNMHTQEADLISEAHPEISKGISFYFFFKYTKAG